MKNYIVKEKGDKAYLIEQKEIMGVTVEEIEMTMPLVTSHSSSQSGPISENSIGSAEIEDGSIQAEDLAPSVRAGLHELDNEDIYSSNDDIEDLFK